MASGPRHEPKFQPHQRPKHKNSEHRLHEIGRHDSSSLAAHPPNDSSSRHKPNFHLRQQSRQHISGEHGLHEIPRAKFNPPMHAKSSTSRLSNSLASHPPNDFGSRHGPNFHPHQQSTQHRSGEHRLHEIPRAKHDSSLHATSSTSRLSSSLAAHPPSASGSGYVRTNESRHSHIAGERASYWTDEPQPPPNVIQQHIGRRRERSWSPTGAVDSHKRARYSLDSNQHEARWHEARPTSPKIDPIQRFVNIQIEGFRREAAFLRREVDVAQRDVDVLEYELGYLREDNRILRARADARKGLNTDRIMSQDMRNLQITTDSSNEELRLQATLHDHRAPGSSISAPDQGGDEPWAIGEGRDGDDDEEQSLLKAAAYDTAAPGLKHLSLDEMLREYPIADFRKSLALALWNGSSGFKIPLPVGRYGQPFLQGWLWGEIDPQRLHMKCKSGDRIFSTDLEFKTLAEEASWLPFAARSMTQRCVVSRALRDGLLPLHGQGKEPDIIFECRRTSNRIPFAVRRVHTVDKSKMLLFTEWDVVDLDNYIAFRMARFKSKTWARRNLDWVVIVWRALEYAEQKLVASEPVGLDAGDDVYSEGPRPYEGDGDPADVLRHLLRCGLAQDRLVGPEAEFRLFVKRINYYTEQRKTLQEEFRAQAAAAGRKVKQNHERAWVDGQLRSHHDPVGMGHPVFRTKHRLNQRLLDHYAAEGGVLHNSRPMKS